MKMYSEKQYKELLEITGFLADVLNEIAYGFVHESDDIPGEGCDCPSNYAKSALEFSYEDFIAWKGTKSEYGFGWRRNRKEDNDRIIYKDKTEQSKIIYNAYCDELLKDLEKDVENMKYLFNDNVK